MKKLILILVVLFLASNTDARGLMVVGGGTPTVVAGSNMTIDVAADLDDGWLYNSNAGSAGTLDTNGSSGQISMGESSTAGDHSFGYYRFVLSSAIPSGATITTATITFTASQASSFAGWDLDADVLRVWGENQADPAQIDNATDSPIYAGAGETAVPLTTAYVDWTPSAWTANTAYASPDIKTIIQELVNDHTGLAQNAHIQIWVAADVAVTGGAETLYVYEYAHATGATAQLYIAWTE